MVTRDPVEVIRIGGVVVRRGSAGLMDEGVDRDKLFRMRKRQRPQQDAIGQTIDGAGGADAESKSKNRGRCEAGRFAQLAQSKVEIRA
jgi:hypothetical protein